MIQLTTKKAHEQKKDTAHAVPTYQQLDLLILVE
jgi:hypothetical protein